MSNLIITIISIGLVAIAAIMGIFYGGTAYQNGSYQAMAATMLSQGKQLIAANTQYMMNKGQSTFQDFPDNAINTGGYLSTSPLPILNLYTTTNSTFAQTCASVGTGSATIAGALVYISRSHAYALGNNLIVYNMVTGTNAAACGGVTYGGTDFSLASSANNPLVQICKQLNKTLGTPTTGFTMSASGLPIFPSTSFFSDSANYSYSIYNDPSAINLCGIGSSGYWGGLTNNYILFMMN